MFSRPQFKGTNGGEGKIFQQILKMISKLFIIIIIVIAIMKENKNKTVAISRLLSNKLKLKINKTISCLILYGYFEDVTRIN